MAISAVLCQSVYCSIMRILLSVCERYPLFSHIFFAICCVSALLQGSCSEIFLLCMYFTSFRQSLFDYLSFLYNSWTFIFLTKKFNKLKKVEKKNKNYLRFLFFEAWTAIVLFPKSYCFFSYCNLVNFRFFLPYFFFVSFQ